MAESGINDREYVKDIYDCDNFAYDLFFYVYNRRVRDGNVDMTYVRYFSARSNKHVGHAVVSVTDPVTGLKTYFDYGLAVTLPAAAEIMFETTDPTEAFEKFRKEEERERKKRTGGSPPPP